MNLKDRIKIKSIEKKIPMAEIARRLGINRHQYYFKLKMEDKETIRKTEKILGLKKGFFEDNIKN